MQVSWPNWMGLQSQTQCFLPYHREAPHSWSAYWRTGWPPWLSSLLTRPPVVCWWSSILPTHGMVGVGCLLCLPALLSPKYNSAFYHQGTWVLLLTLTGYQPLWWWLTSYPKSKRHFGGSVQVQKHLLHRTNLIYQVSYHVTLFPILWWWKGGSTFQWVCAPFVCNLIFPHEMSKALLMNYLLVPNSLDPQSSW